MKRTGLFVQPGAHKAPGWEPARGGINRDLKSPSVRTYRAEWDHAVHVRIEKLTKDHKTSNRYVLTDAKHRWAKALPRSS